MDSRIDLGIEAVALLVILFVKERSLVRAVLSGGWPFWRERCGGGPGAGTPRLHGVASGEWCGSPSSGRLVAVVVRRPGVTLVPLVLLVHLSSVAVVAARGLFRFVR